MSVPLLSVVIPVYNEAANITPLFTELEPVVARVAQKSYEIIYVDDGSGDATVQQVEALHRKNKSVRLLSLSRNFGKEIALAAGISAARGKAVLTLDGDGQHPVDRIPEFVAAWRAGAQVVIGVRRSNSREGLMKKYGSRLFYMLFNRLSGTRMQPGSSDFRLIDREVQQAFMQLHEPNAITRGLIDWLGFGRTYISYAANPRVGGQAAYRPRTLFKLAANSFVSLSPTPLYAFGYLGVFITGTSLILGLSILIQQIFMGDPLGWDFTGTAMLSVLVLFLVGLILVSQGVLALYISSIHDHARRRPLYVVDHRRSIDIGRQLYTTEH